jgi:transcription elongation factor Elf1
MFSINDQVDVHCPRCANDTVYVQSLVTLVPEEPEAYWCRCGKCDLRFRVSAAPIFRLVLASSFGRATVTGAIAER